MACRVRERRNKEGDLVAFSVLVRALRTLIRCDFMLAISGSVEISGICTGAGGL